MADGSALAWNEQAPGFDKHQPFVACKRFKVSWKEWLQRMLLSWILPALMLGACCYLLAWAYRVTVRPPALLWCSNHVCQSRPSHQGRKSGGSRVVVNFLRQVETSTWTESSNLLTSYQLRFGLQDRFSTIFAWVFVRPCLTFPDSRILRSAGEGSSSSR